jgi:protein tyrosine phosphatase (PTP) superfamily phosphohydrolase (DUF442 family)
MIQAKKTQPLYRDIPFNVTVIVSDHLYLGSFPKPADIPKLKELGVEAILSVIDGLDPPISQEIQENFRWAQVPVLDSFYQGVPTIEDLADSVAVLRNWVDDGVQRIYVHCYAGIGRSPTMVMAYMVHGVDTNKPRLSKVIADVVTIRKEADPGAPQITILGSYVDAALHDPAFDPRTYQPSSRVIYGNQNTR